VDLAIFVDIGFHLSFFFATGIVIFNIFVVFLSGVAVGWVRYPEIYNKYDNVLLEYETALKIKELTQDKDYIVPLHVGSNSKDGVLTKFTDFASTLYPDSIGPIAAREVPKPPPVPHCNKCDKECHEQAANTWRKFVSFEYVSNKMN
jgi:hypothetical protein